MELSIGTMRLFILAICFAGVTVVRGYAVSRVETSYPSLTCYTCDDPDDPEDCLLQEETCHTGQVCYSSLQKRTILHYSMGCLDLQECQQLRATNTSWACATGHFLYGDQCFSCCQENLCNVEGILFEDSESDEDDEDASVTLDNEEEGDEGFDNEEEDYKEGLNGPEENKEVTEGAVDDQDEQQPSRHVRSTKGRRSRSKSSGSKSGSNSKHKHKKKKKKNKGQKRLKSKNNHNKNTHIKKNKILRNKNNRININNKNNVKKNNKNRKTKLQHKATNKANTKHIENGKKTWSPIHRKPTSQPHSRPKSHPHSQPKSHPHSQPKPHHHSKQKAHPHSRPKSHPHSQPKSHPHSKPKSHPHSSPKSHPHSGHKTTSSPVHKMSTHGKRPKTTEFYNTQPAVTGNNTPEPTSSHQTLATPTTYSDQTISTANLAKPDTTSYIENLSTGKTTAKPPGKPKTTKEPKTPRTTRTPTKRTTKLPEKTLPTKFPEYPTTVGSKQPMTTQLQENVTMTKVSQEPTPTWPLDSGSTTNEISPGTSQTPPSPSSVPDDGTPPTPRVISCYQCQGACTIQELLFQPERPCPPSHYCMSTIMQQNGQRQVFKKCVDRETCYNQWFVQTSDKASCTSYDPADSLDKQLTCNFCCTTDGCNPMNIKPTDETLFSP